MTPGAPWLSDRVRASQWTPDSHMRADRHASNQVPYGSPYENGAAAADSTRNALAPQRGGRRDRRQYGKQWRGSAPTEPADDSRGGTRDPRAAEEEALRERQLAGLNALIALADAITLANASAVTQVFPALTLLPSTRLPGEDSRPRILAILCDPALRAALALMLSAAASGGLAYAFWAFTAHYQSASAVGSVSAEVSAVTFLASVGSLNLINIFARFLPEAGWNARRMILVSYSGSVIAGSLVAMIFLLTPLSSGLVLGGEAGRLAFVVCVVLLSVFMIQDGGLLGFGRPGWVPVENILVATARLALLPLAAMLLSARIGILWSWALPMAVSVLAVNTLLIGRLAGRQERQPPTLPPFSELTRFVAIESVTTAISAAVSAFLPALVTQRLGASQGGYFYIPWIITTMVSFLLTNILISMVREAVARPEQARSTIHRSVGFVLVVMIVGMTGCIFLSGLVLAPLGRQFVANGMPLLRWAGLALPAMAVNLLYWATCLVRRRPWPVFAVNLTTSAGIIGGVMLLRHGADISNVGSIYCLVQWLVAVVVSIPAMKALRVIRG